MGDLALPRNAPVPARGVMISCMKYVKIVVRVVITHLTLSGSSFVAE